MKPKLVKVWNPHQGGRERARRLRRLLYGKIPFDQMHNPEDILARDVLMDNFLKAVKESSR